MGVTASVIEVVGELILQDFTGFYRILQEFNLPSRSLSRLFRVCLQDSPSRLAVKKCSFMDAVKWLQDREMFTAVSILSPERDGHKVNYRKTALQIYFDENYPISS